ncbi:unnamed protein product [Blepharisma stoltei]|uniref:EF-hand domain-containing protein n=1 Tax=Blepharisma stoltei TaxID=1481888 RepID=A0AAU9JVI1_9CILI|nr:unnamed protein product [Blepharisma stoltei]
MISFETESRLAELLYGISQGENTVEILRLNLCKNNDFEPYSAFKHLDRLGLGSLSSSDLRAFLDRNNLQISEQDSYMIIRQYDSNSDGRLSLNEFISFVLPSTNETVREIAQSRPTKLFLSNDAEYLLLRLFEAEIENQRELEAKRKDLVGRPDFNLLECYRVVDIRNSQTIDRGDLFDFLRKHNFRVFENDIDAVIRRIDSDGDTIISYLEFVDSVLPAEPVLRSSIPSSSFNRSIGLSNKETRKSTSPLRSISPNRNSIEVSSIYRSSERSPTPIKRPALSEYELISSPRRAASPLRSTPFKQSLINSEVLKTSPLRRSPSPPRVSPYRSSVEPLETESSIRKSSLGSENMQSISKISPFKSSPLRNSSLTREINEFSYQTPFKTDSSISMSQSTNRSSPVRNSSPIRNSIAPNEEYSYQLPNKASPWKSSLGSSYINGSNFETSGRHSPPSRNSISPTHSLSMPRSLKKNYFAANRDYDLGKPLRNSDNSASKISYTSESSLSYQINSISKENVENDLISLFKEQIKLSRDLERLKIELSDKLDFNLIDAFRMFDLNDKGSITVSEIENTLKELGLPILQDEVYLLSRHYSNTQDTVLQFSEFAEMFIPKQEEYSNVLRNRIPYNLPISQRKSVFSHGTHDLYISVLKLHLKSETIAESLRQDLSRKNFNIHEAFQGVDQDRNGFITIEELERFLEYYRVHVDRKDVAALLNRYDKNKDGRVSYSEFVQEITPKSPSKH